MEHLRKVYRRQWYESYRINADEYLSVYSKTKAAQYQAWQEEVIKQDKKRREDTWKMQATSQLNKKQREIWQEFSEKKFFYWYERASERLQQLNLLPWIRREDFGAHVERELDKYTGEKPKDDHPPGYRGHLLDRPVKKKYPLNFVGQMPFIEDKQGNIVSAPLHSKQYYDLNTQSPPGGDSSRTAKPFLGKVGVYDPGESKFLDDISTEATRVTINVPQSAKPPRKEAQPKPVSQDIPNVAEEDPNDAIGLEKITQFEADPIEDYTDQRSIRSKGPAVKPPKS